jgi:hypothetical protein
MQYEFDSRVRKKGFYEISHTSSVLCVKGMAESARRTRGRVKVAENIDEARRVGQLQSPVQASFAGTNFNLSHFQQNAERKHQCMVCLRSYSKHEGLDARFKQFPSHIDGTHIQCFFCSDPFQKSEQEMYFCHLDVHFHQQLPFKCRNCRRLFESMAGLCRHKMTCERKERTSVEEKNLPTPVEHVTSIIDPSDSPKLETADGEFLNRIVDPVSCEGEFEPEVFVLVKQLFLWSKGRSHQCECCLRCYAELRDFDTHHQHFPNHIKPTLLECHYCPALFGMDNVNDYFRHLAGHMDEEFPFQCKRCTHKCGSMVSLVKHWHSDQCVEQKMDSERSVSVGSSIIATGPSQDQGMLGLEVLDRAISNSVAFTVSDEQLAFLSEGFLTSKDSTFQCYVCLRTFETSQTFAHHFQTCHSGRIGLLRECIFCFCIFETAKDLLKHIALKHSSGASRFVCHACSSQFVSSVVFFKHVDSSCKYPDTSDRRSLNRITQRKEAEAQDLEGQAAPGVSSNSAYSNNPIPVCSNDEDKDAAEDEDAEQQCCG